MGTMPPMFCGNMCDSYRTCSTRHSIRRKVQIYSLETGMDNSTLIFLLPIVTFVLVGVWMYRSRLKAKEGLPPEKRDKV